MKREFLELLRKPVLKKIARRLGLEVKGMTQDELVDLLDSFDDKLIQERYDLLIKGQDKVRQGLNNITFDLPILIINLLKLRTP